MKLRGNWKIVPVMLIALSVLSACGKPKYRAVTETASAVAGQYTKPKIDILVFQDKSDSMRTPVQNMKSQLSSFISSIDSRWDYRFTVLPLQGTMSVNGKYILARDCSDVKVGTCLTASQAGAFNGASSDYGWINSIDSAIGNSDYGFRDIAANFSQSLMKGSTSDPFSGFLRPGAALAIIVLTNGEDISGVGYKDRGDGVMVIDYDSSSSINSFNNYKSTFTSMTSSVSLARFYSVVAQSSYSNCYGGSAWYGKRYVDMASALNGKSYDLCSGGLSYVLADIGQHLASMVEAYKFNYVVVDSNKEPLVSSIKVKKNGVEIPQSSANGWTYVGYKQNQPTSFYPVASNNRSGYMIQLNGTAVYSGADKISLTYEFK